MSHRLLLGGDQNLYAMGKFINPFTDFGFKHIFGREMDKDILIEFLNDLLEGEHTIKDLRIMNNERLPETEQGRKVIFDIHCETDKGEGNSPTSKTGPCITSRTRWWNRG